MEIYSAFANKHIVFFYEFLGVSLLVYAINMQYMEEFGVAGIAFMLFACLLIAGPITGAHFNPAVTLGVYMSNQFWKDDFQMFLLMTGAQFCGGMFGILLSYCSLINSHAG